MCVDTHNIIIICINNITYCSTIGGSIDKVREAREPWNNCSATLASSVTLFGELQIKYKTNLQSLDKAIVHKGFL